ncbi:MAG: 50S ribosomal protein L3 [Myxococcales bacterium]|nr:50S ribosomal protein L3 [Myxococcales bacterium]MCB9735652.1 50S ribosomal protein L3 [Deltaproteobacteria bacterium]
MARGLIGRKLGMTHIFGPRGNLIAVTLVEAGPNTVIQVKEQGGKDGYDAVKLGFGEKKISRCTRPELGVFKAAGVDPARSVQEFRVTSKELAGYTVGESVDVTMFREGAKVDVTGTSKGRGFAGVIKRHHFKGAKERSHGTHEYKRHGGSIGTSAWPSRVLPGRKMAGQLGNARATVRNIEVVGVFAEDNLLLLKGAVPGAPDGIIRIRERV